ncbi:MULTISPECIES: hemerythrin domain-containing protein [Chromohalobacter]|jgi:hemerythrin-like domain-containing protein|uniref:Hemerythrin HHE cation binding protein n=1 Tax=Chromohalobacter israelensis (strain ATCC BAA-138 / DSM 3043 / CIP 106854 / NCIMB 13768 / 1H11) TaxID=290398 RepID=Q1QTT4_CHRI1|nr:MULTISPECIES: hemerythrin domain-containing protein [Chromohalobacter]ABE60124.1 Hemerythrin HHE cation binding protein [Chromohalobacter salexigens DSM 3043]MDF9435865.1 hemerythrin domain-containing protein [Chromohalobacter israelensis]MDO0945987.1 hemerythrin domain-containing protein [Chromohalobacter salexigens]NQY45091.1 hemerythrin domain-containing protein [Chromohalobacter sp.]PWW42500.1 hemerythrin HHE cation binding domain-containing protein [Chromohalobacter salexigens]
MTLFEALRESHDKQRTLLDLLVKTQGDSDGRDELFKRVRAELEHHAGAEERALYVPMMEHDMTQEKARHSVAEHHEIDELIETLEETDYSSPGWVAAARQLQELVTHHLDEEEQEVFQLAGRVFDDATKQSLAETYQEEMRRLAS